MKRFVITLLAVLMMSAVCAQDSTQVAQTVAEVKTKYTFNDFFNHLTLPLELGCAWTSQKGAERPGFYFRTSLEYRDIKTASWVVVLEYDTYTRKYENFELPDNNTISGDEIANDIFIGGGYRFPLVKDMKYFLAHPEYNNVWSMALMMYVGATNSQLKSVVAEPCGPGETQKYTLVNDETWVPSGKIQMTVDYSIDYNVSVYIGCAYMQHLTHTKLETDYRGMLIFSAGITCFFR